MIYLTQLIFLHPNKEEAFNEFESFAIPLMEKYGGRMIYRIRPQDDAFVSADEELPYEIHYLSFESDDHLENFLKDDERLKFMHLKEESIRSTFLVIGEKY